MELPPGSDEVIVAACDLDKTLYPPEGPEQAAQLRANINAMFAFESTGGFVFPVTGNNLLLAQRKFQDPDDESQTLREVAANPGIFTNGGLVLGPSGCEIERHSLGDLYVADHPQGLDFVSALVSLLDSEWGSSPMMQDVGLCCLTMDKALIYQEADSNGDGYASSQRVTGKRVSREELLEHRREVLLALFLFPQTDLQGDEAVTDYITRVRPWQEKVVAVLHEKGLSNCSYRGGEIDGVGGGIKVTCMKEPWPEIDINVAGVDKGKALSRFLQNGGVLKFLGQEKVEPSRQLVVFGDAPNDVSMFTSVGGELPLLRVGMPHAHDQDLVALSNVRAEVSQVLQQLSEARRAKQGWGACVVE